MCLLLWFLAQACVDLTEAPGSLTWASTSADINVCFGIVTVAPVAV